MQETGVRNGAYGADKFGFKELAAIHWNQFEPTLYEHAIAAGEASLVVGGALCAETGHHTGRSPERQAYRRRRTHREFGVVGRQSQDVEGELRHAAGRLSRARQRQEAIRAGSLRRRRPEIPHQDPRLHRICLAFAVHPAIADPPRAHRARQVRSRTHHRRSAVVPPRRQASRRARGLRHHGGDRFHPQDRADLRLVLRRRDEEVGVHHAQLLSAGEERHADALLGQRRPRRRFRAVLWPLRHRQDHAVRRPEPHAARRRRTRLGPGRHLQLRRRLLRQVHQAQPRSRADDLGRHQPLRRRAGERGVRSGDAAFPITTTAPRPRIRARPIRSTSFRTPRAPAAPDIRRTSSS